MENKVAIVLLQFFDNSEWIYTVRVILTHNIINVIFFQHNTRARMHLPSYIPSLIRKKSSLKILSVDQAYILNTVMNAAV